MNKLKWELTRTLPKHLKVSSVDKAVRSFVKETQEYGKGINEEGQYLQVINYISNACVKTHDGSGGDFWAMFSPDGELVAFALAHFDVQIDNRLTYVVTHGWFDKQVRHGNTLKDGWKILENHAKKNMCKHITLVTDRNAGAFLRVLGTDWHPYISILKKDLEEGNGNHTINRGS